MLTSYAEDRFVRQVEHDRIARDVVERGSMSGYEPSICSNVTPLPVSVCLLDHLPREDLPQDPSSKVSWIFTE